MFGGLVALVGCHYGLRARPAAPAQPTGQALSIYAATHFATQATSAKTTPGDMQMLDQSLIADVLLDWQSRARQFGLGLLKPTSAGTRQVRSLLNKQIADRIRHHRKCR